MPNSAFQETPERARKIGAAPEPLSHEITWADPVRNTSATAGDFEDVMRHPPYSEIIVDHKRIGSWQFGMCRARVSPQSIDNVSAGYTALAFHRKPTRLALEVTHEERPARDYTPGEIVLRPKGLKWATRYFKHAEVSVLALPTHTVREVLGDQTADFDDAIAGLDVRPFWSPLLAELVGKLDRAVFEWQRPSDLYLDTLFQAVCVELWQLTHAEDKTPERQSGPVLSNGDLRRINQYLDEASVRSVDFAVVERLTGLPRSQITAAFKRTVGKPPYQYILDHRIERARFLIESSNMPLSEIAYRCGFSSQAHLTDLMKKKIGGTPGALRKAVRP